MVGPLPMGSTTLKYAQKHGEDLELPKLFTFGQNGSLRKAIDTGTIWTNSRVQRRVNIVEMAKYEWLL